MRSDVGEDESTSTGPPFSSNERIMMAASALARSRSTVTTHTPSTVGLLAMLALLTTTNPTMFDVPVTTNTAAVFIFALRRLGSITGAALLDKMSCLILLDGSLSREMLSSMPAARGARKEPFLRTAAAHVLMEAPSDGTRTGGSA